MKARILLVEDEEALAILMRYNLEANGYDVEHIACGDEANLYLQENPPDLLILDWMLPSLSGLELCRRLRLREKTKHLPVIMVTARGEENERVRGLMQGADDYLTKPFTIPELMARVHALLRRSHPERAASKLILGDIEIDKTTKRVRRGQQEIYLGATEYRLLEFLMVSPGRVFTRSSLLDGIWGQESEIDERTVDVHIARLRKSLTQSKKINPIRTVRGMGYAFDETYDKKMR